MKTKDINEIIYEFQPNFLIIDIEGGEIKLAYQINWHRIKKLLIELHPHIIGNYQAIRIISHLNQQGFGMNFNISSGNVLCFTKYKG